MPGKFELYKDRKGEFRYRLKAANGQIVLVGEGYKAKAGLVKGVESVRKNAATERRFEQKASKSGKAFFVLKATNGQVIGQSEQYESEAACKGGIASVITAPVTSKATAQSPCAARPQGAGAPA